MGMNFIDMEGAEFLLSLSRERERDDGKMYLLGVKEGIYSYFKLFKYFLESAQTISSNPRKKPSPICTNALTVASVHNTHFRGMRCFSAGQRQCRLKTGRWVAGRQTMGSCPLTTGVRFFIA